MRNKASDSEAPKKQVIEQQRAPQITDPVLLQIKTKIQQFRATPPEDIGKRDQKLAEIGAQVRKQSPQLEAILHELFGLFSELYANYGYEFDMDKGPAFFLSEIIYELKYTHPAIDASALLQESINTFPGQKKIIQQKLVRPIIREWAD
jgi:hypothetical protein